MLNSKGEIYNLKASDNFVHVHLRAGKIIPIQPYESHNSMTTTELIRKAGITLLAYPDSKGHAEGTIYIDNDGMSLSDLTSKNYQYYKFKYSSQNGKSLTFNQIEGNLDKAKTTNNGVIDEIKILGSKNELEKTDFACWFTKDLTPFPLTF